MTGRVAGILRVGKSESGDQAGPRAVGWGARDCSLRPGGPLLGPGLGNLGLGRASPHRSWCNPCCRSPLAPRILPGVKQAHSKGVRRSASIWPRGGPPGCSLRTTQEVLEAHEPKWSLSQPLSSPTHAWVWLRSNKTSFTNTGRQPQFTGSSAESPKETSPLAQEHGAGPVPNQFSP